MRTACMICSPTRFTKTSTCNTQKRVISMLACLRQLPMSPDPADRCTPCHRSTDSPCDLRNEPKCLEFTITLHGFPRMCAYQRDGRICSGRITRVDVVGSDNNARSGSVGVALHEARVINIVVRTWASSTSTDTSKRAYAATCPVARREADEAAARCDRWRWSGLADDLPLTMS